MHPDYATEPTWQALYDIAAAQEGLFTPPSKPRAPAMPPLFAHHQKAGRIARITDPIALGLALKSRKKGYPARRPAAPSNLITAIPPSWFPCSMSS